MEQSNNPSEFSLIFKYALKDLSRNYKKLFSIIVTLFISLFILSAIFTIEDSLKKELNDNAKALLGGDLEIDYNRNVGNIELVNKVKEFTTIFIVLITMSVSLFLSCWARYILPKSIVK